MRPIVIQLSSEELQKTKELIAKFMCTNTYTDNGMLVFKFETHPWFYIENEASISSEDLFYDTRWDWLIPVCKKCFDIIQTQERPTQNHCNDLDWLESEISIAMREYDFKLVYQEVVKFIEAYNQK